MQGRSEEGVISVDSELRVGLEIHQQLATARKMFCECPPTLRTEEPEWTIRRRLRPSFSEMGEIDEVALAEVEKGKTYVYQGYASNCLVEADEEPPHMLDSEVVEIGVTVSLLLGADIVEEIHTMRKVVLDGSNTSGFQRTMLFALGGKVETRWGNVGIQTICAEEDAARLVSEEVSMRTFRLDRLGIPLLEIATEPTMTNPEQVKQVAYHIGQILRATKKVKRGLGTIRQDINISIPEGDRVELKGVQDLDMIPLYIENEIKRQKSLASIACELRNRNASVGEMVEVTPLFSKTKSKLIAGKRVFASRMPGFAGLLGHEVQTNRRLASEFADRVRSLAGGLLHSDELPAYGITGEEFESVKRFLSISKDDAFILITGDEERAKKAFAIVSERAVQAIEGVPRETRDVHPDGTSRFLRSLPGAARMYPETDIPPLTIERGYVQEMMARLPELPEKKKERFMHKYALNEENADKILRSGYEDLFEEVVTTNELRATVFVRIIETLRSISKEIDISLIDDEGIRALSRMLAEGRVTNEGIEDALRLVAQGKQIEEKGVSDREVEDVIGEVVKEKSDLIKKRGEDAIKPLMGEVMKILRGKADGSKINEILKRKVAEAMKK
jgi:glutamyl-tRNA(Gln) amidotransferase subunit E